MKALYLSTLALTLFAAQTSLAQSIEDQFRWASYALKADETCQVLTLEGRIHARNITRQVYRASSNQSQQQMIEMARGQAETMAEAALKPGCRVAARTPQMSQITGFFNTNGLALSRVLDDLPAQCQGEAAPYLTRTRSERQNRLTPNSISDADRQSITGSVQTMVETWSNQCGPKPNSTASNDMSSGETSEWEKTALYDLTRPYSQLAKGPAGATNTKMVSTATAWRGLGPQNVIVELPPRYMQVNSSPTPIYIEGLGDGRLQVRLPEGMGDIYEIELKTPSIKQSSTPKRVNFEQTEPGLFHLKAEEFEPIYDTYGSVNLGLKSEDGRYIFTAASPDREAKRDPKVYLSFFLKARAWAMAPQP